MIYLAIDPGLSKIGVAISREGKIAEPLADFEAHNLLDQITRLITEHKPDKIVIGEPDSGPIKDLALVLKDEIKSVFKGEVVLHSEDLSSQMARKKMIEAGMPKQKRQKGDHSLAATIVLQDYLDLLQ